MNDTTSLIDDKALDRACDVYQQFDPPAFRSSMKAAILAYLDALPKKRVKYDAIKDTRRIS